MELADPAIMGAAEWVTGLTASSYAKTGRLNMWPWLAAQAGAVLIAAGLAGYATDPSIASPLLPLAFGSIWLGCVMSPKARPGIIPLICIAVICASAIVAIPLAANLPGTLLLASLTLVLVPLAFVRNPNIWGYFTPVWVIHAVLCFWQWYGTDMSRVTGITQNANAGAALLLLGCIFLLNGRRKAKWIMVPLLMAIVFTGSRWTVGVTSLILLGLFASRYIHWRYIAIGILIGLAFAISTGGWGDIKHSWLRSNTLEEHFNGKGLTGNATETASLRWVPQGFSDNGIHSVPIRMMHETGILSGMAWIAASVYGLWRGWRQRDSRWWMLLGVALLSVMYYHTWLGSLAGFWWLLVVPAATNTHKPA